MSHNDELIFVLFEMYHLRMDKPMQTQHLNDHYYKLCNPDGKKVQALIDMKDMLLEEKKESDEHVDLLIQNLMDMVDVFQKHGDYQPYYFELARLALNGCKQTTNGMVVLTHASLRAPARNFLRNKLLEAGAKEENITMVFLDIDRDVLNKSSWDRWQKQADAAGLSVEEFYEQLIGVEGITDYDAWVTNWQDGIQKKRYDPPCESDHPYKVIDVSARDMSLLDSIDDALSLNHHDRQPNDLSYEEMSRAIFIVDQHRDELLLSDLADNHVMTDEEKEMERNDPKKYNALRHSLMEAEKQTTIHRLSDLSEANSFVSDNVVNDDTVSGKVKYAARRQSLLETGKF